MLDRTCTIVGCDMAALGRGWCQKHYSRWRRTGSPQGLLRLDPIERFRSLIEEAANDCWLWKGHLTAAGYGGFQARGHRYAHRFSYEAFVGPIPTGMEIDHQCRNRACVNPQHLRAVTNAENHQNLSGARSDSQSGVRGVLKGSRNRWVVTVHHQGTRHYGGSFTDVADAEKAAIALRNSLFVYNEIDRAHRPTDLPTTAANQRP